MFVVLTLIETKQEIFLRADYCVQVEHRTDNPLETLVVCTGLGKITAYSVKENCEQVCEAVRLAVQTGRITHAARIQLPSNDPPILS